MSKSLANPFGVLCDDAVEELSYNKKLAKQIVRAERTVIKSDAVPKPKKDGDDAAAKKDKADKKDKKDAAAAAAPAAAKPAAAAAAPAPAAEEKKAEDKPAAAPIKVQRTRPVDSVPADQAAPKEPRVRLTIRRAGEEAPLRAGKREHDRHESGTGRGKEQRKGGAGKANWGSDKDPKDNTVPAVEGDKKEAAAADAAAPAAEKKEGDAPTSRAEAEPKAAAEDKAPEEKSLVEFMKSRAKLAKKVPKFAAKPVADVAEEAAAAATPLAPAAAAVEPAAEKKAAAPAAADDKKAAPAPAADKAKVQLKLVFYDDAERRAARSRPLRDEPDDARPRRDRAPRERPAKAEAPAAPVEAPKPEEFPKLR